MCVIGIRVAVAKYTVGQGPYLCCSEAPIGDCKPHCSHINIAGARHPKNMEFRSTQKNCHQFAASLAELSKILRNRSRVLKRG
jgi:hypothetical protein